MAKPRNKIVDLLQYAAMRTVTMLFYSFPVEANLRFAQRFASVWFKLFAKHRQRAMENLRHAFPELSERQRLAIAKSSMQHLCMLGVELLFTTRLIRQDTRAGICNFENFRETLGLMVKRDRGLIMLTGHYGNWEVLGYVMATMGFETTSVFRPLDNPYINQWVLGVREEKGQQMLEKKGAAGGVEEVLARGGSVGFIADQNAGAKGLFVDFFGRKASTFKSIGLLAMLHEVPIVVGYARRAGDAQFRFNVGVQDVIYPDDWKSQDNPVLYITQRYTRAIEDFVRKDPNQYLWVHRRWKTRPKNEMPKASR